MTKDSASLLTIAEVAPPETLEAFDAEFWPIWLRLGRGIKKGASRSHFLKITSPNGLETHTTEDGVKVELFHRATAEEIIEGAKRAERFYTAKREDREFIVTPFVFLNKGRWEDEWALPTGYNQPSHL